MNEGPEIDLPDVRREVEAVFAIYEKALVANDVVTLDRLFWASERTIRYGIAETLYGSREIAAYRREAPPTPPDRRLERTKITTFGRDMATCMTLFRSVDVPGRVGRQSQTWVRFGDGWKVVAAHVSLIPSDET